MNSAADASFTTLPAFKAYDIRGRVPDELNVEIAFRLGIAFAERFTPATVALGRDARHSGPSLLEALAKGLMAQGTRVLDLGLCGTEEVYWAAQQAGIDGGIAVTASHNPIDHNGMKLVLGNAIPVSGDSGLRDIERRVAQLTATPPATAPNMEPASFRDSYVKHLLGYVDTGRLRPLRIVVNAGNGCAGAVIDALEASLPFDFIKIQHEPDGTFPHGIPNPLLPENRFATAAAVIENKADFGVAWDGDFDRCFLFDENGRFVEGYYIVGLLAAACLRRHPGSRIIHDPRLTWNTVDIVREQGGVAVQCKTGHAFIKERMRREDAIYGGEMSAHHYFREFAYCDNGNIPWLMLASLISESGVPLSALVADRIRRFPSSGEINRKVPDVRAQIDRLERRYASRASFLDRTDGISLEFDHWRFNVRGSNTEPVLRLNVESRADEALMERMTAELLREIDGGIA